MLLNNNTRITTPVSHLNPTTIPEIQCKDHYPYINFGKYHYKKYKGYFFVIIVINIIF